MAQRWNAAAQAGGNALNWLLTGRHLGKVTVRETSSRY